MSAAEPLNQVYLGLGSNIQPELNLPRAVALLAGQVKIDAISRVWQTPPVGNSGPCFLNAVARITTNLNQLELKVQILRLIETRLGRVFTENRNDPRIIDLDILIFNDKQIDAEIWNFAHLCVPLAELYPDYTNPETGETIRQAAEQFRQAHYIKLSPLQLEI